MTLQGWYGGAIINTFLKLSHHSTAIWDTFRMLIFKVLAIISSFQLVWGANHHLQLEYFQSSTFSTSNNLVLLYSTSLSWSDVGSFNRARHAYHPHQLPQHPYQPPPQLQHHYHLKSDHRFLPRQLHLTIWLQPQCGMAHVTWIKMATSSAPLAYPHTNSFLSRMEVAGQRHQVDVYDL